MIALIITMSVKNERNKIHTSWSYFNFHIQPERETSGGKIR
jgi:hypothetical protein|tara:strand:- start:865 stop:987 length:123 start_codon:yes stop_codon:yes gene_type:complete